MAPTIIVGDDESAGDVAAQLLDLADRQRDVRTRTDLARPAFDVPDDLYDRYNRKAGRRKGGDDERRANAVDKMVADDDAATAITSDDELPDAAKVADPADVGDEVAGPIEGDELPDSAKVIDPTPTVDGDGDQGDGDGDQGDEPPADKPKPRKRAARKATPAKKTTPAAAGSGE